MTTLPQILTSPSDDHAFALAVYIVLSPIKTPTQQVIQVGVISPGRAVSAANPIAMLLNIVTCLRRQGKARLHFTLHYFFISVSCFCHRSRAIRVSTYPIPLPPTW